jgi:hypothetical protein
MFIDKISSTSRQYRYLSSNAMPKKAAMKINRAINKPKNAARKSTLLLK